MSATANPLMLGAPNPGANFAGWSIPTNMPGAPSGSSGSNPYMPIVNPSSTQPSSSNPYASGFPANNNGYGSSNLLPNGSSSIGSSLGFGAGPVSGNQNPFHNTFTTGENQLLSGFLSGGAGFNQQAINNLIAAMQPGFQNAQQNLLQQFSAGGSRFSSGAQLGLSNLESQEQLNIGALESQMYEQSVSNYLDVLMGAMNPAASASHQPSMLAGILGGAAQGAGAALSLAALA